MDIINVDGSDARSWLASLWLGLLADPYSERFELSVQRWERDWRADRTWGVRDRDRWVGTLATEPRILTVPGVEGATNDIGVDAVTGVSVSATHRRRGLLTRMMRQSLTAAHARGDAASVLIAAEWPIYGRFGYAPATDSASYTYFPRQRGAAVSPVRAGRVHQVDRTEVGAIAATLYDVARRRQAGQIDRGASWWDRRLGLNGYDPYPENRLHWFVHDGPDGPDGLLSWKPTREFELDGRLGAVTVPDLVAADDAAYRDLWAYLSALDVVEEIELPDRPAHEPVRWLLDDARTLRLTNRHDFLWLRLLDVPAALAARTYAAAGTLVLDVIDEEPGRFAAGRYRLEVAADGRAACARTDAAADVRIGQRALAGAYLGGRPLRARVIVGDTHELTRGSLARLDLMLTTAVAPWNATGF